MRVFNFEVSYAIIVFFSSILNTKLLSSSSIALYFSRFQGSELNSGSSVDPNMTTSSTSLLPSQSHRNVSGEIILTSVVDMKLSPMATTRAAESIQMSNPVQTVGPSVSPSVTSVSLLPSSTSTVNVTLETSSQTDDDIIVMSYTTPCYITYVITQTLNETRAQSTTVAMVTSSRNTTASSTEDRTVPSTFNVSESQSAIMTPTVTMTTSNVSIPEVMTSSNGSVVMEDSKVSTLNTPPLFTLASIITMVTKPNETSFLPISIATKPQRTGFKFVAPTLPRLRRRREVDEWVSGSYRSSVLTPTRKDTTVTVTINVTVTVTVTLTETLTDITPTSHVASARGISASKTESYSLYETAWQPLISSSSSSSLISSSSSSSSPSPSPSAVTNSNFLSLSTKVSPNISQTLGMYGNSTSSTNNTSQNSSATGASSSNATNNLTSTAALVSSTHGSSTMIPAANSSSISPGISDTPSIATRPSINESSTAPPVAVPMTTATVTMTTSITNTSNLNNTRVLQTSSTGISPMVSLSLVSRSLNVTATTSSDIGFNQSHVANNSTTHPTSFTTFTQTLIHPTPKLTSLTPSQTTSDVTSGVDSSSSRKNILLTTSSLGICYVVYTTRIMLSSSVSSSSSVTASNQTTAYKMSTINLVNTSYMTVSSTAPSMSLVEMNSTVQQMTSSFLSINVTSSSVSIQETSSSVQVNATPALNSTQTSSSVSKSVAVNTTSVSPIATSMPSVVSMATSNSTLYPSTASSSVVEVVQSSEVINSSSLLVYFTSTSSLYFTSSPTSSTLISPSTTSVVMTTSSVVTTTLPPPTTLPAPDLSLLIKTTLEIPRDIDENSAELRRNISKGLEEAFNTANNVRGRIRGTEGTEAKIYNITRKLSPSTDAEVLFTISRNGNPLSANDAVNVYNKTVYLFAIGVWKVIRRPEEFLPPPPQSILVSMIFETIVRNLSVPSNKKALEDRLASYYKSKANTTARVTAKIYVVLLEKTGYVYVQFYVTVNGTQVPAATVVRVFEVDHVQQLTACLQEQVIVGPYTDESLRGRETDYVQTRIALPSSTDIQDPEFHTELGDKLARAYISGKAKGSSRRKRRAVGSVSATIVNSTAVNELSSFADVKFFISDSGKVANATYAAAVFNRLTTNEMSLITSPYAIIIMPKPVIQTIIEEFEKQVIIIASKPYWIIGAVLGPILLIIIIILFVYWKWKTGVSRKRKIIPLNEPSGSCQVVHHAVRMRRSSTAKACLSEKVSTICDSPEADLFLSKKVDHTRNKERLTTASRTGSQPTGTQPTGSTKNPESKEIPSQSKSPDFTTSPASATIQHQNNGSYQTGTPLETGSNNHTGSTNHTGSPKQITVEQHQAPYKCSASRVPAVAFMGKVSGNKPSTATPVRFRRTVHQDPKPISSPKTAHVKKPNKLVKKKQVSRVHTLLSNDATPDQFKHKADIERLLNKKRQRLKTTTVSLVQNKKWRGWEQDGIDQVLDPRPVNPFIWNKPHRSKKTAEDVIELKSYRSNAGYENTMKQFTDEISSSETDTDSSIDMEETRNRVQTLLSDAFSWLGPSSKNPKQVNNLTGEPDQQYYPSGTARYAGSRPALPEPAPAHGRATEPTPRQRRRLGNTGRFPHALPQTPIGSGYPLRPPVRPPLVTSDPVVVWDPYDRQRYINQRMGFQPQGGPNPTYTFTDPQGQNVYITPVQQQRDYLGGPIWSPYTSKDTVEELNPDLAKTNHSYRDVTSRDAANTKRAREQTNQRSKATRQVPEDQALIRLIREELLRMTNVKAL